MPELFRLEAPTDRAGVDNGLSLPRTGRLARPDEDEACYHNSWKPNGLLHGTSEGAHLCADPLLGTCAHRPRICHKREDLCPEGQADNLAGRLAQPSSF